MTAQYFLSASIPLPGREPFDQDIQLKRIRDAILALVTVCRDNDVQLVFGGHPAISPLVHHAAETLRVMENIFIYQSEFFRASIPAAAGKFPNLRWTKPESDAANSIQLMRMAMLEPVTWQYSGALFVGGMEGIYDEALMFHRRYPGRPLIPLRETGGASRNLIEKLQSSFPDEQFVWHHPVSEEGATSMLRYRSLLIPLLRGS